MMGVFQELGDGILQLVPEGAVGIAVVAVVFLFLKSQREGLHTFQDNLERIQLAHRETLELIVRSQEQALAKLDLRMEQMVTAQTRVEAAVAELVSEMRRVRENHKP